MSHHHTGVFHAYGAHRHHEDPQHIKNILHRAATEAQAAGYSHVHASLISDGSHEVLHNHHPAAHSGEHHGEHHG